MFLGIFVPLATVNRNMCIPFKSQTIGLSVMDIFFFKNLGFTILLYYMN